jgi:rhodanese-related sulfurtransferase
MRAIVSTLGQAGILLALSFGLGLGINTVRGKDHIKLTRNHTPMIPNQSNHGSQTPEPYQVVGLAELARIVGDPTRTGLDVVVDARNEHLFAQGHIPGALLCDPYNLDDHIDQVLNMALGAERVIVYCHGGDCQDSYLLCQELLARGVPKEQLYVFKGGWEAWRAYVDRGREGSAEPLTTDALPTTDQVEEPGPHPFREVDLKEAVGIFEHEHTADGLYVFVDARADGPYEAGHIPGAVQCDYYRIDYYFPELLAKAAGAEKLVVYCNGGDCEDSLYVCGELLKADIPRAHILLFKGGWQEWKKANLPIATGRE